ncbi:MAG: hypothetical protein K6F85_06475 [Bacteroidales bacterium]|nr:hypothetical protein [Bacteroidales bacterium]
MKTRNITLAAAALLSMAFTACVPDIDLKGHAWTGNANYNEDGERINNEFALVCNSDNSGTLFISETSADDPMGLCLVMPFSYTWDDNNGTATIKYENPEEQKTQTFTMPLSYTKTEGLVAYLDNLKTLLDIPYPNINLTSKNYANPSSLVSTHWVMDFDEEIGEEEEIHYHYELEFVNATGAVLSLTTTEGGEENLEDRWNVNYTYSNGVGHTSIYFFGETIKGGFYLPDATHMIFSDGENRLNLVKKN